MIIPLLYTGILLTPFLVWPGYDSRYPKEILGLGLALSIALSALSKGEFKPFKNHWILIFLLFSYLCILTAPMFNEFLLTYHHGNKIEIMANRPIANIWMFKASYYFILYGIMMMAVASLELNPRQIDRILTVITLCGFLMAVYIFIQALNIDPLFQKISKARNPDIGALDKPLIGGFMGQATLVATYISMLIPLALFLRRYVWVVCMVMAVAITGSKGAYLAVFAGALAYFFGSGRKYNASIAIVLIAAALCAATFLINRYKIYDKKSLAHYVIGESSGRIPEWIIMAKDFREPFEGRKRALLGFGPGSLHYSHSVRNNSRFLQSHNDPFEFLINFGIAGFSIFLLSVASLLKISRWRTVERSRALLLCLLTLSITSLFTFSFQLAPNIFYASVMVGLLHNRSFVEGSIA